MALVDQYLTAAQTVMVSVKKHFSDMLTKIDEKEKKHEVASTSFENVHVRCLKQFKSQAVDLILFHEVHADLEGFFCGILSNYLYPIFGKNRAHTTHLYSL